MTSRIFNFYISSDEKTTGTNNNANYFIDWSAILPRGKYKCNFTYTSCFFNYVRDTDGSFSILPALLHINLGCNSNYIYSNNIISNTDVVGILKWYPFGEDILFIIQSNNPNNVGKGFLNSDITTNKPFYFNNGMFNNFINIKITKYDGYTLWIDSNNEEPEDYVICLTFELME